jgi:hypothetical protein
MVSVFMIGYFIMKPKKNQKFPCSSNNVCTKFNVTTNSFKIKKNIFQENTNKFAI